MRLQPRTPGCLPIELLTAFAIEALPAPQASSCRTHIASCADCLAQLEAIQPVVASMRHWPVDVMRPAASVWERLAKRIGADSDDTPRAAPANTQDPSWMQVSEGIFCKVLSADPRNDRISLLVRLKPGTHYPPHEHADAEELHLLDGELWIDERKLVAGDYNRAEPGSVDARVFSETGCTCVLVTSARDQLIG